MEILERIRKKVQEDAAFSAALKEAKNAEEVLQVLLAAGFQVTLEEVLAMAKTDGTELNDEQMEMASGGFVFNPPDIQWPFW